MIWILSFGKHFHIVICFQYHIICLLQMKCNFGIYITHIGGKGKSFFFIFNGIAHTVGGIVRYVKSRYLEITNQQSFIFFDIFFTAEEFFGYAITPLNSFVNLAGGINRNMMLFSNCAHCFDVIGMIVCHKNSLNVLEI